MRSKRVSFRLFIDKLHYLYFNVVMQNYGEHECHSESHIFQLLKQKSINPKSYFQYPIVFAIRSAGNEGIGQKKWLH